MSRITEDDYRTAMALLDESIDRCAALLGRHNNGGRYKAVLDTKTYADLALRLARALGEGSDPTSEEIIESLIGPKP